MLVYRVFPYLSSAVAGEPGHPTFVHPDQGDGRVDNPHHYRTWYLAYEQSGAIGEVFANMSQWSSGMFAFPDVPGSVRALGTYSIPDTLPVREMDDAQTLVELSLRPTQVVTRNRPVTQAWALRIFHEMNTRGEPVWHGVSWWSFHLPTWRNLGYWGAITPTVCDVQPLSMTHIGVVDAADALNRTIS